MERPMIDPVNGHPRKWQILAIMCTCLILVVAGVSSLNIAIPSIIEDLNPSSTETLWIVDAYALVFAGLLLPAGAIGDRYGRKGALLTGLGLFAAGAIWSSYAGDPTMLIIARGSMGIGAALVMPATLSILVHVFPVSERAKAIAVWSGFAGAGGAIGIIGGGALLEVFWWGSVFFINVPIAAVAALLIALLVPTSRDPEIRPLDPIGSVLSIIGLGALVFGIIEGGEAGWGSGLAVGAFIAAAVFLFGFVRYELRVEYPMLDPRLFRHRPFALGSLTITVSFLVMFGFFFIITQYFQFGQGHSPLSAGVRMLPFALSMIVVAPQAPRLAQVLGKRGAIAVGLGVQALGFTVLRFVGLDTSYLIVVVAMILLATGMATLMPAGSEAIVSSLPPSKAGVGSAVNDTTREVGGALGIAVLGTLLASGYRNTIEDSTGDLAPEAAELAEDGIGGAFRVAEQTGAVELIDPAREAFIDGMSLAFSVAVLIGLVAIAIILIGYPRKGAEPPPMEDAVIRA
ncbi:MAG: MFS transporter [Acidimicrobiales bacterium]|nr:MFS transporter [Acidimicrobiales bacterium]